MGHLLIGDVALPPPAAVVRSARALSDDASPAPWSRADDDPTAASVPTPDRPLAMALEAMVHAAARDVLDRVDAARRAGQGDAAFAEIGDPAEAALDRDDAVILDHQRRISALAARIEAARAAGTAPQALAELGRRLLRAKAAHRLAVARAAGVAVAAVSPPPRPAVAPREGADRARAHAGRVAASGMAWVSRPAAPRPARLVAPSLVGASVALTPGRPHLARRASPLGLARARRSLAVARRLLAGPDGGRSDAAPTIMVANLWQWQGSGSWSLASTRPAAVRRGPDGTSTGIPA